MQYIEDYVPVVKFAGLNTAKAVDFTAAPTVALPGSTTIDGQSVVALGNITSNITTGVGFSVAGSGVYTGTGFVVITKDSATTGTILALSATGLTSGTAISVASAESALTSGKYLNLGGVFTVAKFGATVIAGSASGTAALTLTAGDFVVTSGFIVVSANAKGITFTGTGANGGVLKNLKNAAATALSGTNIDIAIDIDGTPYYFTVYPTKA